MAISHPRMARCYSNIRLPTLVDKSPTDHAGQHGFSRRKHSPLEPPNTKSNGLVLKWDMARSKYYDWFGLECRESRPRRVLDPRPWFRYQLTQKPSLFIRSMPWPFTWAKRHRGCIFKQAFRKKPPARCSKFWLFYRRVQKLVGVLQVRFPCSSGLIPLENTRIRHPLWGKWHHNASKERPLEAHSRICWWQATFLQDIFQSKRRQGQKPRRCHGHIRVLGTLCQDHKLVNWGQFRVANLGVRVAQIIHKAEFFLQHHVRPSIVYDFHNSGDGLDKFWFEIDAYFECLYSKYHFEQLFCAISDELEPRPFWKFGNISVYGNKCDICCAFGLEL